MMMRITAPLTTLRSPRRGEATTGLETIDG